MKSPLPSNLCKRKGSGGKEKKKNITITKKKEEKE
jgi:hypothetical protein